MVSLPPAPDRELAPELPVMVLARSLPRPVSDAVPVRIRFSMPVPSWKLTTLDTVSVPLESEITSPALLT
ncbi:hypothetical protein C2U72_21950 [Prosthecomicrobium hirschii]|nr:hypothetical protein C2U72_21950 [Prosthecomicrobium hirschii]